MIRYRNALPLYQEVEVLLREKKGKESELKSGRTIWIRS